MVGVSWILAVYIYNIIFICTAMGKICLDTNGSCGVMSGWLGKELDGYLDGCYGDTSGFSEVGKWPETREILRDGIASGRGVHRKMGVWIQESRSKIRGFS